MDAQKVDLYLMNYGKYFEPFHISSIREALIQADDSKLLRIQMMNPKDPTIMLIVSIIGGHFGIDRFLIGDTGLGVAKLLTCGGLGIWTVIDWFLIMGRTREVNFEKFRMALM